jgi:hypothetical protein
VREIARSAKELVEVKEAIKKKKGGVGETALCSPHTLYCSFTSLPCARSYEIAFMAFVTWWYVIYWEFSSWVTSTLRYMVQAQIFLAICWWYFWFFFFVLVYINWYSNWYSYIDSIKVCSVVSEFNSIVLGYILMLLLVQFCIICCSLVIDIYCITRA